MYLTIAIIIGFLLGFTANATANRLVKRRYKESFDVWYINKKLSHIVWGLLFSAFTAWQWFAESDILQLLRLSVILFACSCITATDALIRKVPNSMLGLLLINALVFKLIHINSVSIPKLIMAVVVAIIVFQVPSLFKLTVGWGDIKFAIVAAVELSLYGFLQAMILVGLGFLFYAIYLLLTKKGNLKTQIPMGPFIAFGVVFTSVCPIL